MTFAPASISKNQIQSTEKSSDFLEKQTSEELQIQKRLLTPFFTKNVPPLPSSLDERKVNPQYRTTNPFSRLFYWWLTPLLAVGYKRTIQPNDLYLLDDDDKIDVMYHRYITFYNAEVAKLKLRYEQNPKKFRRKKKPKKPKKKHQNPQSDDQEKNEEDEEFQGEAEHEDEDDFVIPVRTILFCLFKTFWAQYSLGTIQRLWELPTWVLEKVSVTL
ncbi:unnamed protein product [Ambrosiozyma monospora]|uniref:Unnamed protein product n=1 Tax=Ambrosiozyma monospora TaxID=43982 RepID=A0ACB5SZF8_AMBMO|nr:unnamed protein product [Ambrosiozyma monospora]